tara:strand:+ start:4307 stop:4936 length:630 start_codon:yes stop_codon:yes gene_type:complete
MSVNYPTKIPIFPLSGVIFFPTTNLPLNIFEERYLSMVNESLKSNSLIGMVQSVEIGGKIFQIGCLGKIDTHSKTDDGRILINLLGLSRFKINNEVKNQKPYREFNVDYNEFKKDLNPSEYKLNENILKELILNSKKFFDKQGIAINWGQLSKLKKFQQIYTLAMICPISINEKQKLLEIVELSEIANTLNKIIQISFYEDLSEKNSIQ